jgi:hypothetical protein
MPVAIADSPIWWWFSLWFGGIESRRRQQLLVQGDELMFLICARAQIVSANLPYGARYLFVEILLSVLVFLVDRLIHTTSLCLC